MKSETQSNYNGDQMDDLPPSAILVENSEHASYSGGDSHSILLRTELLSSQRMNRNLQSDIDELKNQLLLTSSELQETRKKYAKKIVDLESDLELRNEMLEEAVAEISLTKEKIDHLERENLNLKKKMETKIEISELASLLQRIELPTKNLLQREQSQPGRTLLREFSTCDVSEDGFCVESPALFVVTKRMNNDDMSEVSHTSGNPLLDKLRTTLAFWKQDEIPTEEAKQS